MKPLKQYLLIIALSILPLIHIFISSGVPHTSDGLMHIARSASYYKELAGGQFPVRWASQLDYGYGTPLFNFFSPLPYVIGAASIAMGFHLTEVLKIGFALTYILAGIFMLMFCRARFKDEKTAFFVAIMYQFAPFRFVDMLVRGDLGTLYSYMTLPLVFYAITLFLKKTTFFRFALLAISVALLPLGHNIVGFMFFVLASFYVFFATKDVKKIAITFLSMGFGLLLVSFFILPVFSELKYINGYIFSKDLFWNHFPPLYKLFLPNIMDLKSLRVAEVSVQIGLFHTLAFIIAIFLLVKNKLKGKEKSAAIYFLITSFLLLILMQPITKPLWENIKYLRQFQFPWRFLAIITFTSSVLSAVAVTNLEFLRKKSVYIFCVFLVVISTIFYWAPYQGYQKINENYYWNFPGSTNYFAEVNTVWMAHEPTEYPKNRIDLVSGLAVISDIKLSSIKHTYTVTASNAAVIVDNTYFYPGWKVTIDGKSVPIEFQDQNYRGLITFNLPEGKHYVVVKYYEDLISRIGDTITLIALILLITGTISTLVKKHHEKNKR